MIHRFLALLSACSASGLLGSCESARFYSQAVNGQAQMLRQARKIELVEADPESSKTLRGQLALVDELKQFARTELHLPVQKQYRTFADLRRPYAVVNVYAAPEFSVEAKTWWYPFVGAAKYRGFFDERMAREEAAQLRRRGYDVYLGGVRVYSTLGWFPDPVLNTFIGDEPSGLAETVFHELTHARVFIRGDSDFNEAFATANAQEGVRRWLRAKGDVSALARFEEALRRDEKILALLARTRVRLNALYENKDKIPVEALRQAKARELDAARREYAAMQRRGEADHTRDGWFGKQFNNARLASVATYYDLVPAFEAMLRNCHGDLERFYASVAEMRKLEMTERRRRLQELSPPVPSAGSVRS
ncbi:MAG TPA: aminopeptidase [Verrucomicrobiaceae bacterium]